MTIPRSVAEFVARFAQHPLHMELLDRSQTQPIMIRTPREVLGEKMMFAHSVVMGGAPAVLDTDEKRLALANVIMYSSPSYLWKQNEWNIAISAEIPPHTVPPDQLPFNNIWFTFEHNIDNPLGTLQSVDAMLICQSEGALIFIYFGLRSNGQLGAELDKIEIGGKQWPDDFLDKTIGKMLGVFSFLRSPHIDKEERRLNRSDRRQLEREHREYKLEDRIHFITLRRHYAAKKTKGEPRGMKYDHQWMVSGHNRNQWYPSTQSNKMIWISPYMKGPEDAPIKPRGERMYKVER